MNERELQHELESWLADPVPPLDERTLYQAIDRIPSVPQRRRWWPFSWFPFGIGATRSARPSGPRPKRRSLSMLTATRIAAAVVVVALSGALALVAVLPQGDSAPPMPAAVTDAPEPTPDGVHVSGTVGFVIVGGPAPNLGVTITEPDGSERYRDAWFETVWTSDDPRFNGTGEYSAHSNSYPTALGEPVTVGWGTQTLATEEGAWTARPAFGLIHGEESIIPLWFDGEGAYEGLSAMIVQQVETLPTGNYRFTFDGWVVPGDAHFEDALE
mgnify:CR=1 FL=1